MHGKCFCGAVEIEVAGEPKVMGFCHCTSCRSWGAAPVNAFSLWDPQAETVTKGEDKLATYNKTKASFRASGNLAAFAKPLWIPACAGTSGNFNLARSPSHQPPSL